MEVRERVDSTRPQQVPPVKCSFEHRLSRVHVLLQNNAPIDVHVSARFKSQIDLNFIESIV